MNLQKHLETGGITPGAGDAEPLMAGSEQLMQLVLGAETFGTWRVDAKSGHCWWSPNVYRIHGLEPAEGPVDLVEAIRGYHPHDASTVTDLVERAITEQVGFSFVLRLKRADGTLRLVESVAGVEIGADNQTEAIFGLFRDVTDRRMERDLSESRGQLVRSVVQNSPTPIVVTDTRLRYLQISPSWIKHHNLPPAQQILGMSHYDVMPYVPAEWHDEHRRALAGEVIRRDIALGSRDAPLSTVAGSVVFPWRTASGEIGGLILMVTPHVTSDPMRMEEHEAASVTWPHSSTAA